MEDAKWKYSDARQSPPLSMNLAVEKRPRSDYEIALHFSDFEKMGLILIFAFVSLVITLNPKIFEISGLFPVGMLPLFQMGVDSVVKYISNKQGCGSGHNRSKDIGAKSVKQKRHSTKKPYLRSISTVT